LADPIQQRHWLDADPRLLGRRLPAVEERMKKTGCGRPGKYREKLKVTIR
jgi:hypothetical protein